MEGWRVGPLGRVGCRLGVRRGWGMLVLVGHVSSWGLVLGSWGVSTWGGCTMVYIGY